MTLDEQLALMAAPIYAAHLVNDSQATPATIARRSVEAAELIWLETLNRKQARTHALETKPPRAFA
jgi:hypothetical protein